MSELPTGTVTFLFTDLEGSTRLWEEHPEAMRGTLAHHDAILQDAVRGHGGRVVKATGDGLFAVFATARDALDAAVAMQRGLAAESFGETGPLWVRMGVHTCEAEYRDGDYFGGEVNRAARLMSVAHGGQIVVSSATSSLVRDGSVELIDLGEHRLRDLTNTERVFQLTHPELRAEFPPLRSLDTLPGNLPRQVTTFVGREREIATLCDLVRQSSLVTLTGVGGVGKTRLALQVAATVVADFPDGAWLCEFAPVTDSDAVWETLAASLRVQSSPVRALEESVLEYLAPKRALLVLDNCEHLLDAIARQADAITQRCPRLAVFATSREGLALAGERMVAVPSLGVPTSDAAGDDLMHADAVRLFADRAGAARSDFALTDRNAGAVAVLCRRLDGIPLAIELAAARVRSMSVEDLVSRLDQRFKLLTQGSRAALERHQTLRNTIDWSYDLLDPTERQALNGMSVFAGTCDLEAAEAVLSGVDLDALDVADVLGQLVDKSLVVADDSGDGGVRYRLLETIRQYAREQLQASGDTAAVRRRHAEHYVAVAERAGPHLRTRDQAEWARAVARDTDNFRVALDWAVETASPDHALRLVTPLTVGGFAIGDAALDWAETATTIPGAAQHPLIPRVAAWASWGATNGGDFARAEELITVAEAAEQGLGAGGLSVLRARAVLAMYRGDLEQAQQHGEEWVEHARGSDDYELAHALILLAAVRGFDIPTIDEAVRVARDAGIATALSLGLVTLAMALPIEESDRALGLLDEAIELGDRSGDRMTVAMATVNKAGIAARRGEWHAALRTSVDAAEQQLELGHLVDVYGALVIASAALREFGHLQPAAVILGKTDTRPSADWLVQWGVELDAANSAALLEALGDEKLAALTARGAGLDTADAVAYLRAETDRALRDE